MLRQALLAAILLLGSGCVLPRYTLTRPETTFVIRGSNAQPIQNAAVTVFTASNPYNVLRSSETLCSDAGGRANFESTRKFEVVVPVMIHGVPFYYSAWCIEADGYGVATGEVHTPDWGGRVEIHLAPSAKSESCEEVLEHWFLRLPEDEVNRRLTRACS